jgi:hypothetical protein
LNGSFQNNGVLMNYVNFVIANNTNLINYAYVQNNSTGIIAMDVTGSPTGIDNFDLITNYGNIIISATADSNNVGFLIASTASLINYGSIEIDISTPDGSDTGILVIGFLFNYGTIALSDDLANNNFSIDNARAIYNGGEITIYQSGSGTIINTDILCNDANGTINDTIVIVGSLPTSCLIFPPLPTYPIPPPCSATCISYTSSDTYIFNKPETIHNDTYLTIAGHTITFTPVLLDLINISWTYNYKPYATPPNVSSITAEFNGVYGIQAIQTGLFFTVYWAVIAVTTLKPKFSITVSDGILLYDNLTIVPPTVTTLFYAPIDGVPPFRYKTYINGKLVSGYSSINLDLFPRNSKLFIKATDCCGNIATAIIKLDCRYY